MPPELTLSEASRMAWTLCDLAGGESALTRTALSWTFRNRLAVLEESQLSCSYADELSCSGKRRVEVSSEVSDTADCDFQSEDFCMALSSLCMVWSGALSDPTDGALSFHRHDQRPPWARSAEPCALIGSYFFYQNVVEPDFASEVTGDPSGTGHWSRRPHSAIIHIDRSIV